MEMKEKGDGPDQDPHAYKLLLTPPSALSRSQLSVVFHPFFDRIPHPNAHLENSISQIWDQRVQGNPSLYNGKKFRYGGCITHLPRHGQYHAILHLGLTDHRTFVGTNLNPLWESFLLSSQDEVVQSQRGCTISARLYNLSILQVHWVMVLLLRHLTKGYSYFNEVAMLESFPDILCFQEVTQR